MAKARPTRARRPRPQGPPPVRVHKPFQPLQPTRATLTDLLAAAGRARRPGAVVVCSGIAHRASRPHTYLSSAWPPPGWGMWLWDIPAPPPGEVLWFTLEFASQWWRWASFAGPTNNSGYYKHVEFGLAWRWMLVPDPYTIPGYPALMDDSNRYEFYASEPPGGNGFTAWWVHPYRSVTLTPYGKEADPNALATLLATERNGELRLSYAYNFSDITVNGKEARGYTISGGPDTLFYSYAVVVPRAPKVEPVVAVEDLQIASRKPAGSSKSRSRARSRG